MHKYFLLSSFICITMFSAINGNSQTIIKTDEYKGCDTLSKKKFYKLVRENIRYMKKGRKLSVGQTITLVKIWTTTSLSRYYDSTNAYQNKFEQYFRSNYSIKAFETLECIYSRGVVAYSEKYDLFIGPGYKMKCYNYYELK
jgi:hypothetical protein